MRGQSIQFAIICCLLFVFTAPASVFYVDVNSTNPVPPYAGWSTASTDIQSAIDASSDGDLILVTNGLYNSGGRVVYGTLTNRVVINKAVTVQSVNGPAFTMIQGNQPPSFASTAVRCVYMTNSAALIGFTLTNGETVFSNDRFTANGGGTWCESTNAWLINCLVVSNIACLSGGGVWSGSLSNCTLTGNMAGLGGLAGGGGECLGNLFHCVLTGNTCSGNGGGANSNILNNCVIKNNSTPNGYGGGAAYSTLNSCLVCSNQALNGGGVYYGALTNCTIIGNHASHVCGGVYGQALNIKLVNNCIIYYNTDQVTSSATSNYFYLTPINYCCTWPLPTSLYSTGNITNAPLFVNLGNDFHLQSNSACINAGKNAYVSSTNDLDGNPRIVGGTVDIGCYEYQTPSSVLSYAWAQQYGLPTDGTADYADSDGDGMGNYAEWKAGTIPTDATSVLKLSSPANSLTGITVTWQSVSGVTYYLQSSTNFPAFTSIQSNLVGQASTTSYTDTTATNGGPYFYRIGVQ